MTDDTSVEIEFKGYHFKLYTPFSDYLISNKEPCSEEIWEEFIHFFSDYKVRWWEKIF
jgi:hypothetical protein